MSKFPELNQDFVDTWVKIIQEDMKHRREYGWSYFDEPQKESEEEKEYAEKENRRK